MKKKFSFYIGITFIVSLCTLQLLEAVPKHEKVPDVFSKKVQETRFVILSLSYNNSSFCEKSLLSSLDQNYENFRVIYVNDASTDNTLEKVRKLIESHPKGDRVELIHNEKNRGGMANHYCAVHSCAPDEVVVVVDGDDFLVNNEVLNTLNKYYLNPNIWLTYGSYDNFSPKGNKRRGSFSKPFNQTRLDKKGVRGHPWVLAHLRTYYAGLFQRIPLQDFLLDGVFFARSLDVASMLPMVEMAGVQEHSTYIPEVLYLYNTGNPISDHKVDRKAQTSIDKLVRSFPQYRALHEHPGTPFLDREEKVDILICSENSPQKLSASLESLRRYVSGAHRVVASYKARSDAIRQEYAKLKGLYPEVHFVLQKGSNFASSLTDVILDTAHDDAAYVVLTTDDVILTEEVDLASALWGMRKTGAFGFFLKQGIDSAQHSKHIEIGKGISAWQFSAATGELASSHRLDMALYRKDAITDELAKLTASDLKSFTSAWESLPRGRKVGLCFDHAKVELQA